MERCAHSFHLHCARGAGCTFYPTKHVIACATHAQAFQHETEKDRQDLTMLNARTHTQITLFDLLCMLKYQCK